MTGITSHNSKLTPMCLLHNEKITDADLLYEFKIAFPASLLDCTDICNILITHLKGWVVSSMQDFITHNLLNTTQIIWN